MTTEQLTGLQMAIALLAQIGDDDSDRAIAAVHAAADERAEMRAKYDELLVALHGIGAALEIPEGDRSPYSVTCGVLERLHDAAAHERNTARGAVRELERQVFALQQQRDVLQTCLDRHQRDEVDPPGYLQDAVIRAAGLGALHTERDAAIKERDELRARLAGIEAQEPAASVVAPSKPSQTAGMSMAQRILHVGGRNNSAGYVEFGSVQAVEALVRQVLRDAKTNYARPVPAQAVPDADGARFRWLCEDHSDRETRERCRSLIDRLPVMSYSDAVMSIDAAMAAAPEHEA